MPAGIDAARAAYQVSVAAGTPKSARALAADHDISRRQAANIIGAETHPALTVVRDTEAVR